VLVNKLIVIKICIKTHSVRSINQSIGQPITFVL